MRIDVGRAPKYRTKGCSRYWCPKFTAMKWLKCCQNQCSRSRAVSEWAWTPLLCDTLALAETCWVRISLRNPCGECEFRSLRNDNKNFSTITFALSKFYCRGVSHENKRFWSIFLSAPKAVPPPPKCENFIFLLSSRRLWEFQSEILFSDVPL